MEKPVTNLKEWKVVARKRPSEENMHPTIYKMTIFARNEVVAKSKFFYYVRKLQKCKKRDMEVLQCQYLNEKNPNTIKNIAIWLRYNSRSGVHNMYKEYRDITRVGAVSQMYNDMASRHSARAHNIHIIKMQAIENKDCRRDHVKAFHQNHKLRFPIPQKVIRKDREYRNVFNHKRLSTFERHQEI